MSPTAPGNAELMRAIEALRSDFRDLAASLREDYLRKDVAAANEAATAFQIKGLEDEVHLLGKNLDGTNTRIDKLTDQRNTERDDLIKQLQAGRRWVIGLGISAFVGPVATVLITKAIGL